MMTEKAASVGLPGILDVTCMKGSSARCSGTGTGYKRRVGRHYR
jgi:hypothetical protein